MPGSSIGKALVLTTFGESHGVGVGGVLDGFPSRIVIDFQFIQAELDRRRPGLAGFSSPRRESDRVEFLSGIYDGMSTGAPIAFIIRNEDQRSPDYDRLAGAFRPSHADYTWQQKYGIRDHRGGGRSSARETAARVAAGALAKIYLGGFGIEIRATAEQIGPLRVTESPAAAVNPLFFNPGEEVLAFLKELRENGDTTGGIVSCRITGVPPGLGEPVFDKLQSDLAKAMLSINSVKGFEYGSGFAGCSMKGSGHNDVFSHENGKIITLTNNSGGIQGGISNGMDIRFKVGFKPVATLMQPQPTIDSDGNKIVLEPGGRHDVCVVPRALVIVEAMAALTIADHMIRVRGTEVGRES